MNHGSYDEHGVADVEALTKNRDPSTSLFKRWEALREMAERVLGVHVVLTPASDGMHIRVSRGHRSSPLQSTESFFVSALVIRDANVDVVTLNILQGIKDVGGFHGLH